MLKSIFLPTLMCFWPLSPLGGWHCQSTAVRAGPWLCDRKQQDPPSWEVQHSGNWKGFCGQVWQKCCFPPELPASHRGCRVSWQCVTAVPCRGMFWFAVLVLDLSCHQNRAGKWGKRDLSLPLHIHPQQERTVRPSGKAENGYWN